MDRLKLVKKEVENLYIKNNSAADEWVNWGYKNHVLVVAKKAKEISSEQSANAEKSIAGALLHDIADAVMERSNKEHVQKSLSIAGEVLKKCGFSETEINEIVNEIIAPHSCASILPILLEGKVLATADAMAHFQTDFYPYFAWQHYGSDDYVGFKNWVLKKMEKDYAKKIFFKKQKEEIQPEYEVLKLIFSK